MSYYTSEIAGYLTSLPFAPLLIVKSTVALLVAALVALVLRKAAASMRYAVWALAIAVIVALPVGMVAVPSWAVRVAKSPEVVNQFTVEQPHQSVTVSTATNAAGSSVAVSTKRQLTNEQKLALLWSIGSLLLIARMIVARFWLARLTRRSIALTGGRWSSVLARESSQLGVERSVRLFESNRVSTPLTAGIANPFIVLPAGSSEWNDEHRQIVLRHELSHIARGDAFICVLSGIACAIYWFNPLVWVAARKLRSEQEHACDDRVITLGTPAAVYATHLLEVARSARSIGMSSFVSVAMARPSQLEGRLLAVLNDRRRSALTRARGAGAILIACLTFIAIAAIRPTRAESAIVVASQAAPVVVTAEPAIIIGTRMPPS